MKVYIAGPISGFPLYNFPAFDEAAAYWRGFGHQVTTPADITRGLYWERYGRQYDPATDRAEWGDPITCELFRRDLDAVCTVDSLVLLPGWLNSRGARMEVAVACALGKRFVDHGGDYDRLDVEACVVVNRLVKYEAAA